MTSTDTRVRRAANKITLAEDDIPTRWYSILPDLPRKLPPVIDPAIRGPGPGVVPRLFPRAILEQEFTQERWVDIPGEVRDVYRLWRPTPLYRARRLESALKTPAKIYYKYEGTSPAGSHKVNTAVAQAYYNKKEGTSRMTTETGAGQWGSALSFGCNIFGIECTVYMVRASYDQKPYRRVMMELWGAEVLPSPSQNTQAGRKLLKERPDHPGSLGVAISEAVEDTLTHEGVKYGIGSVFNHVLMHQTVIGQETQKQMQVVDDYPDIIFGCIGGGSSYSGLFWPFYYDKVSGKAPKETKMVAVEPTACPSITKGEYMYDHGDTARLTPLVKMYTLGHEFIPPPIHAGGLRYHGKAPTLGVLAIEKKVDAVAYNQIEVFDAASLFVKTEGIVPAPEPAHAIKAVVDEALRCKQTGEAKTILFLLSGHGHLDLQAYDDFLSGKLPAYEYPEEKVKEATDKIKELYPWLASLPY